MSKQRELLKEIDGITKAERIQSIKILKVSNRMLTGYAYTLGAMGISEFKASRSFETYAPKLAGLIEKHAVDECFIEFVRIESTRRDDAIKAINENLEEFQFIKTEIHGSGVPAIFHLISRAMLVRQMFEE